MLIEPPPPPPPASPRWGQTTKLIVGLTTVSLIAALIINYRSIIGPLILAFILAYLLHPVAVSFSRVSRLPWRPAVTVIYLLLIAFLLSLFTLTGLAILQQIQSLIGFVTDFIPNLQNLIGTLSTSTYRIGPFLLDFSHLNLQLIVDQLLAAVQPLLGRLTAIISGFATGAGVTLGWTAFVLLITYFLLVDAGQVTNSLVRVELPGYGSDIRRLSFELKNIWNAFLRGQLIIISLVIIVYFVIMMILGVRFAIGIAILAGLSRFVPYVGPFTTWTITFLVAFFQGGNYFGLQPFYYAVMVVVIGMIVDSVFDNIISPRLLGQSLGVHPAAVLVAAIIAANLIGIIGLVMAAPVLATLKLLGRYVLRKMFDLDPWPASDKPVAPVELPWLRVTRHIQGWIEQEQARRRSKTNE